MSALGSLKLVAAIKPAALSPALQRRNKLIAKIGEQQAMAQAQVDGTAYAPTKVKRIADDSGEVKQVTVPKRVKAWWWKGDNGKTFLGVRYGNRMLELAKGKAAVEVANAKELVSVLGTLRKAVEQGELDAQIEAVGAAVKARLKKK
jgi:hypothetical protein